MTRGLSPSGWQAVCRWPSLHPDSASTVAGLSVVTLFKNSIWLQVCDWACGDDPNVKMVHIEDMAAVFLECPYKESRREADTVVVTPEI